MEDRAVPTAGALDETFGAGGIASVSFGGPQDLSLAVALQADGKIVTAGFTDTQTSNRHWDVAVARFNANGTLDSTFGTGGKVTTNIAPGANDIAKAVAIQSDGKIVVAVESVYQTTGKFAVVRYNANGTLDKTFDKDGIVTTAIGSGGTPTSMALQANGNIVVGGTSGGLFALARYNSNGSLDTSFDGDGIALTNLPGNDDNINGIVIQSDGRIIAAGSSNGQAALARYNPNGTLDSSFGNGGTIIHISLTEIKDIALQADGRIVAVNGPGGVNAQVWRFNSNGSLDTTFGAGGIVTTDLGVGGFHALNIQQDGKIVATGNATNSTFAPNFHIGLVRYTSDGSLDASFGNNGMVITAVSPESDKARDLLIQSDGKIVVASTQWLSGLPDVFTVVRYLGDGSPQLAEGGARLALPAATSVTSASLVPIVIEALARWRTTGITAEQLARLQATSIHIADLDGAYLGLTSYAGANTRREITLDVNAAGFGWFIDPTPASDLEFTRPGDQGEPGRMDLLTVVMHELGHVIGLEDVDPLANPNDLMALALPTGTRRTPYNLGNGQGGLPTFFGVGKPSTPTHPASPVPIAHPAFRMVVATTSPSNAAVPESSSSTRRASRPTSSRLFGAFDRELDEVFSAAALWLSR